ncbi:Dot/Icm T4SS effector Lem20 [Legionella pneumophila serogroup 1]|uniref:Dot/Icm T4SS effector Lem20 n=1 Tax=Legionella pneumophila TaxID=446 RepID=UPI0007709A23|nr:Dot/Icm T4SS effector Lem20 [Legionella pneumophila]HAT8821828.1 Dot/Icm T4SS effector Lem20 [Legionella pneumophila subsp. pneumophila]MCZ4738037.1 Dot/Icm T4SS effector Lem20 [Legionella pneumophila]MDI9828235.1 Dot/Icm T4SS effector Lem20 [Legionella pneumophila]MDO5158319.1 Dot/Icm T4SS effector Lem20 [Legionella pneumophila]MDO5161674.1 Dot/Icm T4SS effector Lem20 [Legionella pneumophila]
MKSKEERFNEWRQEKAKSEQAYIKTVPLVEEYIKSFDTLAELRNDVANPNSEKIKKMDAHKRRTLGVLLYAKLKLDEVIEKISDSDSQEKDLLIELNNTLSKAYDNPKSDAKNRVKILIETTEQLLDIQHHSYPQLAKELCADLYALLCIAKRSLKKNEILASWFIDVHEINKKMEELLAKTEEKVESLDKILSEKLNESLETSQKDRTIQEHFNERFTEILSGDEKQRTKLDKLKMNLKEVAEGLSGIVGLRKEKATIGEKIKKIEALLKTVEENDKKVTGRQYFLDLLASHKDHFNTLMSTEGGELKKQLAAKIEQLKNPDFYQTVSSTLLWGASWATSLGTVIYRQITPQAVQDRVSAYVPATLDSEAKALLQELARQQLIELKKQHNLKRDELVQRYSQLSSGSPELEKLITNATSDHLEQIAAATTETSKVLDGYDQIEIKLKDNVEKLKGNQLTRKQLSDFIEKNDTWIVKLSNWLAENIHEIFKSDTARMIDKARKAQQKLGEFERQYQTEIESEKAKIENNDSLSSEMKVFLKNQFEETKKAGGMEQKPQKNLSKETLQKLFVSLLPEHEEISSGVIFSPFN